PGAGGIPYRPLGSGQPALTPPAFPPAMGVPGTVPGTAGAGTIPAGGGAGRGGPQTVLDEKPLRVTMLLHVVKLLPRETRR
ncbi:MAG: hypothetical protein WHT82_09425, partial [Limisphaera sp.]